MRISDWSSDVCSSDLGRVMRLLLRPRTVGAFRRMDRLNRIMLKGRKPNDLACSEVWIPRRDGGQLRVVVYKPKQAAANLPAVLWLHGGGYLMGTPEQDITTCRRLITAQPCVIDRKSTRLNSSH